MLSAAASVLRGRLPRRSNKPKRKEARVALQRILFHCLFIVTYTIVAMHGHDNELMFYFKHRVHSTVTAPGAATDRTFDEVTTVAQYYEWLGDFIEAVYTDASFTDNPSGQFQDRQGFMLGHDMLLGGIRVSQLRSTAYDCRGDLPEGLTSGYEAPNEDDAAQRWVCYYDFSFDKEEKSHFGHDAKLCPVDYDPASRTPDCDGDAVGPWSFARDDDEEGMVLSAQLAETLPAPGFSVVLPRNVTLARQYYHSLIHYDFIDLQTRAVFVDLAFYNLNLRQLCAVRLLLELPISGGVFPTVVHYNVKPYLYETTTDWVMAGFAAMLCAMVVLYVRTEVVTAVRTVRREPTLGGVWENLKDIGVWRLAHLGNLALFILVVTYHVRATMARPTGFNVAGDEFIDMRSPASLFLTAQSVTAVNLFCWWLELFKFTPLMPRGVGMFLCMALVVSIGSALAHQLGLGWQLSGYRNLWASTFSLFRSLRGDFGEADLLATGRVLGPILFLAYFILLLYIIFHLLVAIFWSIYDSLRHPKRKTNAKDVALGEEVRKELGRQIDSIGRKSTSALSGVPLIRGLSARSLVLEAVGAGGSGGGGDRGDEGGVELGERKEHMPEIEEEENGEDTDEDDVFYESPDEEEETRPRRNSLLMRVCPAVQSLMDRALSSHEAARLREVVPGLQAAGALSLQQARKTLAGLGVELSAHEIAMLASGAGVGSSVTAADLEKLYRTGLAFQEADEGEKLAVVSSAQERGNAAMGHARRRLSSLLEQLEGLESVDEARDLARKGRNIVADTMEHVAEDGLSLMSKHMASLARRVTDELGEGGGGGSGTGRGRGSSGNSGNSGERVRQAAAAFAAGDAGERVRDALKADRVREAAAKFNAGGRMRQAAERAQTAMASPEAEEMRQRAHTAVERSGAAVRRASMAVRRGSVSSLSSAALSAAGMGGRRPSGGALGGAAGAAAAGDDEDDEFFDADEVETAPISPEAAGAAAEDFARALAAASPPPAPGFHDWSDSESSD